MDIQEPTDIEYLKWLRDEVRLAFFISTGRKLWASGHKENEYYKLLSEDMIEKLTVKGKRSPQPPGVRTLIKFFTETPITGLPPNNIIILEDYVFAVKEIKKSNYKVYANHIVHSLNFQGAKLINSVFRDDLGEDRNITHTDFYLGKHDDDCQWYGIVRHWDCERDLNSKVKDEILKSFNWKSRVAAVITGSGGCGKSTFLRRLAIDCIDEGFRILWIDDFTLFCNNDLLAIGNNSEKYLVILEDWTKVENNTNLTPTFFDRLLKIENVRIIIGDRLSTEKKEYDKYVLGNNTFELPVDEDENKKIIAEILDLNRDWQKAANKILLSNEIYNAPLYLILFVLARDSEGIEYADTKNIISRFRDIVENDLSRIYKAYPGLVKTLFYWSCICEEYKSMALITWEALLKLSDSYNGNNEISKRFTQINPNNPITDILSHYISVEEVINPELLNTHVFRFHHELLVQDGLSQKICKEWYFDKSIKFELIMTLLEKNEIMSAGMLFSTFMYSRINKEYDFIKKNNITAVAEPIFENEDQEYDLTLKLGFPNCATLFKALQFDRELKNYYSKASYVTDERYWQHLVVKLMTSQGYLYHDNKTINTVLKSILDNGCKVKCIVEAYEANLISSNHFGQVFVKCVESLYPKDKSTY